MLVHKGKIGYGSLLKKVLEGEVILPSSYQLLQAAQLGSVIPEKVWIKGPDGEILYLMGGKYHKNDKADLTFQAELFVFEEKP